MANEKMGIIQESLIIDDSSGKKYVVPEGQPFELIANVEYIQTGEIKALVDIGFSEHVEVDYSVLKFASDESIDDGEFKVNGKMIGNFRKHFDS